MKNKIIPQQGSRSFELYLNDIRNSKSLTTEEENYLAKIIKSNKSQREVKIAEQKLISANLRFVVSCAKNYLNQGLPEEDLVSIGNLGLIKAARKFEADKNIRFISYAVWWVRQSILQALAEQSRPLRVPLNVVTKIIRYKKANAQFYSNNRREPTIEDLSKILDLDKDDILNLRTLDSKHLSLDAPLDHTNISAINNLEYEDENSDELIARKFLREDFNELIATLTKNEQKILKEYYGLNENQYSFTLEEIGQRMDLTRERVRQIKTMALIRLRKKMKSKNMEISK